VALNLRDGLKVIMLSGRLGDGHGLPVIRKPFLQKGPYKDDGCSRWPLLNQLAAA
jgi:hypothetical protein